MSASWEAWLRLIWMGLVRGVYYSVVAEVGFDLKKSFSWFRERFLELVCMDRVSKEKIFGWIWQSTWLIIPHPSYSWVAAHHNIIVCHCSLVHPAWYQQDDDGRNVTPGGGTTRKLQLMKAIINLSPVVMHMRFGETLILMNCITVHLHKKKYGKWKYKDVKNMVSNGYRKPWLHLWRQQTMLVIKMESYLEPW